MSSNNYEKLLEHIMLVSLVVCLFYALYEAGNDRSFDNTCTSMCAPARSISPIIEMKNQCLCDEGHGKWRYQDVKRAD